MNCDILLLTRTRNEDYRWIYRPDYVDSSINRLLRPLFMAIEDQANRDLFEENGNQNLFFYTERNYCALVYLYFTERKDAAGRRIYALEGLVCQKSESRLFWKMLPFLIEELYGRTLCGRYYQFEEDQSVQKRSSCTAVFCKMEKYLEVGYEEYVKVFKEYDDSFLNLIEEMHYAESMYSFIYGNQTKRLPSQNTERRYQIGEERKTYTHSEPVLFQRQEEELSRVFFRFRRHGMKYEAGVLALSENNETIAEIPGIYMFDRDGISVKNLSYMQKMMEKQMDRYGFRMKKRLPDLRWEQKEFIFQSERVQAGKRKFPIYRIKCRMSPEDGRISLYKRAEDQGIRQLFQYAFRIERGYFAEKNGRDTIYILNQESGLWIFSYVKQNEEYFLEGIYIENGQKEQAWFFLEEIMREYVLPGDTGFMDEFGEICSSFFSDVKESMHPGSYILSAVPKEYFPHLANVKIYTPPGMKKLFYPVTEIPDNKIDYREDKKRDSLYLIPPLIGKKWTFHQDYGRKSGISGKKFPCTSIVELSMKEGYWCNVSSFLREIEGL